MSPLQALADKAHVTTDEARRVVEALATVALTDAMAQAWADNDATRTTEWRLRAGRDFRAMLRASL